MPKLSGLIGFLAVLVACSSDVPKADFAVTQVIPSVARPGQMVTVFGHFQNQPSFTLDGQSIPVQQVTEQSATLTLPETLVAGRKILGLVGAAKTVALDVIPEILTVDWDADHWMLTARGWNANTPAQLDLGNIILPMTASGTTLIAPMGQPHYGALTLRLVVNNESSEPRLLGFEAASITGNVEPPGRGVYPAFQLQAKQSSSNHQVLAVQPMECNLPDMTGLLYLDTFREFDAIRLTFKSHEDALLAENQLKGVSCVTRVQWDDTVGVTDATIPTDTPGNQWFWPKLGIALHNPSGGEGVTVAVIDTGVYPHAEFKDNLLPGYNFLEGSTNTTDQAGHGTHVTGLIAAHQNLTSAAPQAHIVPIKVLARYQNGSALDLARAILWAVDALPGLPNPHPADIINMSVGTSNSSEALQAAVEVALAKGTLLVAAAGNSHTTPDYPAAYSGVVAVTSVSGPLALYQPSYANFGPGTQISAFGGDTSVDQDKDDSRDGILSTDLDDTGKPTYRMRQGTSMATPQVVGIAAWLLSKNTPRALLRQTLLNTTTDLGVVGFDDQYGAGLVQALNLPRDHTTYVVATTSTGRVAGWTAATVDGTYVLNNLPTHTPLLVQAYTDSDHNGIAGEAGDLTTLPIAVTLQPAEHKDLSPLTLQPTDGSQAVHLK